MFEFQIKATEKDPTGYYLPRWDQAERLTVKAKTKAEAEEKVKAVLGKTGKRRGWPWVISVDAVKEL